MVLVTAFLFVLTVLFSALYIFMGGELFFTLAITVGTFLYHFVMRFFAGWFVNAVTRKKYNPNSFWFREKSFEPKLYKFLNVKSWKNKMPSWNPDSFDLKKYSPDEIVQGMCVAELVHELIIVLGYFSLLFCLFTDSPKDNIPVFLITSILAGGIDSVFVVMQRYNRPRILKLKKHKREL